MNQFVSRETAAQVLQNLKALALPTTYDHEKHRVVVSDAQGNEQVVFRLPLPFSALNAQLEPVQEDPVQYVILLIQAGNCALGYFEDGVNLHHKVFRSYMVRKKQGKSQIKYLKTKGKSRAGSRVRLGETAEFFENINGRLQEYFAHYQIHRIALSCSKTLLPYLFDAKVAPPFQKRDERILKIPKHIHTPIYEVMMNANRFLLKGELIFDPRHQDLIHQLLPDHQDEELPEEEEDFGSEEEDEQEDYY
ncbi:hypothetical protein ACD591_10315 [Rufibacter glacialis]|uniref:VLRF1 domain-containing protein n=1 Tax=Rufibacter glacialis TaxID=1259555 RepID=A0A5M8Q9N5_9BACT|nr:hypothetical protein [Rufibacter glacialis]KAA6431843.1 hypothetical protein FOE74_17170 [Rufibacter glacialis]GGK81100.1 hypothetical protein GCM10011405_31080 [Rufibacter glacialis]